MTADDVHETLVALFTADNSAQLPDRLCLAHGSVNRRVEGAERAVGDHLVVRRLTGRRRFMHLSARGMDYMRETIIDDGLYPGPRLTADLQGAK